MEEIDSEDDLSDILESNSQKWTRRLQNLYFVALLFAASVWIYEFGFSDAEEPLSFTSWVMTSLLFCATIIQSGITYLRWKKTRSIAKNFFFFGIICFSVFLIYARLLSGADPLASEWIHNLANPLVTHIFLLGILILESSRASIGVSRLNLGPAKVLALSFVTLILAGTGLLLLPNSTQGGISFVDALFTSTSAVCVTGLAVLDTGTTFTHAGQNILIILFQLGGLGMMTFTSFFSLFFYGNASFSGNLYIKELVQSKQIGNMVKILLKIVFITFLLEVIGILLIFFSTDSVHFADRSEHIYFSIFHGISAFCNAGFTLVPNGFHGEEFGESYGLHLILAFLIIAGGLGFSVLFNYYTYLKTWIIARIRYFKTKEPIRHQTWQININTRIILFTTFLLLGIGTVSFFIIEYNNAFAGKTLEGKIISSFFAAVTPRSGGLNTIDLNLLTMPSLMLTMLLMWIGGSPGSMAGGIKTTTFMVATLNMVSLSRGKDRIEFMKRKISEESVRRAFSVISLSLLFIGLSIFGLSITDPDKGLLPIAFECFSAYSIVGLSLGATVDLSEPGKIILVSTMFIGRIGALTFMVAVFRRVSTNHYRYPSEEILIN
ncbi:MAG: ATPase [Saprospiraceae bacterium]|nr:ATPase [Saprospiraceae bacterium]